MVVHTSGTVAMKQLDLKLRRGVFYPLQTFSATSELHFSDVPFCIETLNKDDSKLLQRLAAAMGSPYYMINTEQRQALHLSAVFINNFTNQLYRIAHELSDSKNINFDGVKIPFAAYQKKNAYDYPLLETQNYKLKNFLTKFFLELYCLLIHQGPPLQSILCPTSRYLLFPHF